MLGHPVHALVLAEQQALPIEPARVIEDEKHRAARQVAERWEWPGW